MDYDQLVVATTYDAARALTSADAIVAARALGACRPERNLAGRRPRVMAESS